MTSKQEERIKLKIKKIKAALAADKKRWGGFHHDGQGLRYDIPSLYIKLGDYSGGLRYLNWFNKTFPDDSGFPDFLFELTIILFKTGRIKEAEKMAFKTFCRNTYLIDKFFEKQIIPIDKWEGSNLENSEFAENYFDYSCKQDSLSDFATWLDEFIATEKFSKLSKKYIEIQKQLSTEHDYKKRRLLTRQTSQPENEF